MPIDFTGRQMEISPDLRNYTEDRLQETYSPGWATQFDLHVILTAEKHRRTAEFTLKFRQHTVVSVEETADIRTAINGAVEKLTSKPFELLERRRTKAPPQTHRRRRAQRPGRRREWNTTSTALSNRSTFR